MKKLVSKIYRAIFKKEESMADLYEDQGYLEAYSRHTDKRVLEDPKAAVGGHWDEIGMLQFEFLKARGLTPSNTLLDIGCGTLRGGRHFISFLNAGNYTGMDISPNAIEYAEQLVKQEGMEDKRPKLVLSQAKDLQFTEFPQTRFDFILAQSVFTHLMPKHIAECFAHVGKIMKPHSLFFFTYFRSDKSKRMSLKDFSYPLSYFQNLADSNNFTLVDWTGQYPHPKRQNMLSIQMRS
jgi:SAM-dependent methyltransferase